MQRQSLLQQGTWTCEGNSLIYVNSSGTFVYTLLANGTAVYGLNVMTRIGPGEGTKTPAATRKIPSNCIDATGLPGYRPGSLRCEDRTGSEQDLADARNYMTLGRAAARYRDVTDQRQAAGQYTNAAEAFTRAGFRQCSPARRSERC